jgi:2-methylcitrate dehydratase PrpD
MRDAALSEVLSDWLVKFRNAGASAAALSTAADYVLDWLGSNLAGQATPAGKMLLDYAGRQPAGNCPVLGTQLSLSAEAAALVNGALSHIVEMDDLDRRSVLHPGAVVIPAALAVAERQRAARQEFLLAVIAGYEIAIRIGEAVGKQHYYYFHNTATCGAFGAAAAAGFLMGLDTEAMTWALGNAGTQAAGLWQFNQDGDMSKHLHAGRAAANGVLAADLAASGFTGARQILEGQRGFFAALAPGAQPSAVSQGLDDNFEKFKISGVSIKPHASCRHTHPAIDAALQLKDNAGSEMSSLQLDTYQAALDLCDNPDPQTPYAAKFSLQYCVACALVRGHVGLFDFTPSAIADEGVRRLMPDIRVGIDAELESRYPIQWPTRLKLVSQNGQTFETFVPDPKGDPENPLSRAELEDKFRQLAAFGQHGANSDSWLDWIADLAAEPEALLSAAC